MNIIYVWIYSYVCTYIFRHVPTVGGLGGPLRDIFGTILGQKNWGKKVAINPQPNPPIPLQPLPTPEDLEVNDRVLVS